VLQDQLLAANRLIAELQEKNNEQGPEYLAMKKNYFMVKNGLEEERLKNENISLELISMVNENRGLREEINEIYRNSGQSGEEKAVFSMK